ncbi:GNAT family N-acetyltransferase [Azospirillum thermophilum]|uniref:N-acetyltransferase n=1 Tax=Azospirillum thermophilum TaxID=2202148 RepID=A0A2S2CM47_9PROT|nr:GNAT family N-acetyltransferase [Azospirillum thermophilum]AWK85588.1 N-acetyltransferase [Azospirillum thermophilum]
MAGVAANRQIDHIDTPAGGSLDRGTIVLPVTIRTASADDLPRLEWFGLHTPHRGIIAHAYGMQQSGAGAMLVAEVSGFPAGQVCVDFARKRHQGRATLWALRVFEPFRGQGLGARLVTAAERVAVARGFRHTELGVDRDNGRVLPFYERLGYEACGTESGQYSYRTPDGVLVRVPIDQWLLHKMLGTAPSRLAAE